MDFITSDMISDFVDGLIAGLGGGLVALLVLVFALLTLLTVAVWMIVCRWKCFTKMGEEGWKSIIPIYGKWVFFRLTMGQGWIMLLTFLPYVGSLVDVASYWCLFSKFGKGFFFKLIGIFFLPISVAIIAFGKATYQAIEAE